MNPYDLSPYHLTLPVDKDGNFSGKAVQIESPQLVAGYQSRYFQQVNNAFVFLCPDGGAVTDTAHYARSELRNETEWSYKDQVSDTPYNLTVVQLGEGQKVVVGQIHDQSEPWLKVEWTHRAKGGELRALVKIKDGAQDTVFSLLNGLKLGEIVSLKIQYYPSTWLGLKAAKLVLSVNGQQTKISMHRAGKGGKAYFKRGCYYQSEDRKGNICIVQHS